MRIGICGDDEREMDRLSGLMGEYRLSRGISLELKLFRSGMDFLCDMKGGEFDLVLLQAAMAGISGSQAAKELRETDRQVRIAFLSELPEFEREGSPAGTFPYLTKPVDGGELFSLLDRVREELAVQERQGLVVKSRKGVVHVSFAGLEYVEVINKTVSFHLADGGIYEVAAALADFEEKLLERPEFFKTHRSYVVNLDCVQAIDGNGVMTKNGHRIPVSRQRRNQLQDTYVRFMRQAGAAILDPEVKRAGAFSGPERRQGPWRVLLVDDEPAQRTFWADILRRHGCVVRLAGNGRDALKMAGEEPCDCVLLDVMIPGEDGFAICEQIRGAVGAPIIFLSCVTETDKQVEGFAAGGIDYITKDTPEELFWAKVETRMKLSVSDRTCMRYGPLVLDLTEHKALIDGEELFLTSVEFDLLLRLAERADHVFAPEEIFGMVWGSQLWDGGQTVQAQMSRLRRKLEKAWPKHHFIETVWGQGYRFVPMD